MIVSTRGVKFKFATGEKVLCYEPDPTKAKVLYESKVLNLVATRDINGRKICEYLIHFYGWNSSWDRYVKEEFILPYTEENKALQAKLAEEAALTLKTKKKHKLPPLIKETLSKKMCAKNESKDSKTPKSPPHSSSDSESSEDEVEKEVIIEIPNVLKTVLEEDFTMITEKNKFVRIPCEPNVIAILESFVRNYVSVLLNTSPPKKAKDGQKLMPTVVRNKLNLCKETMDGVRVFFDFTLPHLLLYRQEKKQFYTIGTICAPIYNPDSYKGPPAEELDVHVLRTEELEQLLRQYLLSKQKSDHEFPKTEDDAFGPPQNCRLTLRHRGHKLSVSDIKVVSTLEIDIKNVNLAPKEKYSDILIKNMELKQQNAILKEKSPDAIVKKSEPKQQHHSPKEKSSESSVKKVETKQSSPKEKHSKMTKAQPKSTTTRILRSSDRHKRQSESDDPSANSSALAPESPAFAAGSSDYHHPDQVYSPRVTRQSGQTLFTLAAPPLASTSSSPIPYDKSMPNSPTSNLQSVEHFFQPTTSSNYFSSSNNSSTHSTYSNTLYETQQYHMRYNSRLVEEIMWWHMVPESLYQEIPAAPSLVYGAHHLLRLFVKLPELMSKMTIKQKKLEIVLDILEKFLFYLAERKDEFFSSYVYMDSSEVFPPEMLK